MIFGDLILVETLCRLIITYITRGFVPYPASRCATRSAALAMDGAEGTEQGHFGRLRASDCACGCAEGHERRAKVYKADPASCQRLQ
jgi:hypothetical protein